MWSAKGVSHTADLVDNDHLIPQGPAALQEIFSTFQLLVLVFLLANSLYSFHTSPSFFNGSSSSEKQPHKATVKAAYCVVWPSNFC